jgi:alpha-tubulin suppressor-like RCC1 family protein
MLAACLFLTVQSSPIVQVSGNDHLLALSADGKVYGWGRCSSGQLGTPDKTVVRRYAVIKPTLIPLPEKMAQVYAHGYTSFGITSDGSVYAWGSGYQGELGCGDAGKNARIDDQNAGRASAEKIPGLTGVKQLAAAGSSIFALKPDGTVYGWGDNTNGLLADGIEVQYGGTGKPSYVPTKLNGLSDIVQLAGGTGHMMALTSKGKVITWGSNTSAELGHGPKSERGHSTPQEVPGLTGVVQISGGLGVSTVLKSDGTVWVWGGNTDGLFGNGEQVDWRAPGGSDPKPRKVPGLAGVKSLAPGLGGRYTVVLMNDGTLRTWGNSDFGQCAAGVTGFYQLERKKPQISGVKKVFACGNNGFAIRENGDLYYWGAASGRGGILSKDLAAPNLLKW